MLRVILAAAVILLVLVAVKDGRVLRGAGLVGSCAPIATPATSSGAWAACRPGRLEGTPDLRRHNCERQGSTAGSVELWRCPTPLASGRG